MEPQRIKCACFCVIESAKIRQTRAGQEYLSIIATSGPDSYRTWIALYGSAVEAVIGQLRPEAKIYVEGWLSLPRDREGERFLRIDAEIVQPVGEIDLRRRARPKPAKEPASRATPGPRDNRDMSRMSRPKEPAPPDRSVHPFNDPIDDIFPPAAQ